MKLVVRSYHILTVTQNNGTISKFQTMVIGDVVTVGRPASRACGRDTVSVSMSDRIVTIVCVVLVW